MTGHNSKTPTPITRPQVIALIGGAILVGAAAWGIGWGAHALLGRQDAPGATASLPGALDTSTPSPASYPTMAPTHPPTSTSAPVQATSTAAPTVEHTAEMIETLPVIASDRGLYDVVRRACGLPKDALLAPGDEIVRETRRVNGFSAEDPTIFEGQAIQVPTHLCP